ncbi:MaoC/PaaZ C-terminal domain-containing protein [Streptomyces sp. NPDC055722]
MTTVPNAFMVDQVGMSVPGQAITADPELASNLSATLADRDPEHLSGRAITPMFNILPIYSCMFLAVDLVTPEQARPKIVHGAHDIRFVNPIRVGATLSASATVAGVRPVRAGAAVSVRILVSDDRGTITSEQWASAIVRGETLAGAVGANVPEVGLKPESAQPVERTVLTPLNAELPRRFADISNDRHAIHLDDLAARSAGFDGVIMHGLCTMGLVSSAVAETVCPGRPARLARLAARFTAPAYPRGILTTTVRDLGGRRHEVTAVSADGTAVIRKTLAEVAG